MVAKTEMQPVANIAIHHLAWMSTKQKPPSKAGNNVAETLPWLATSKVSSVTWFATWKPNNPINYSLHCNTIHTTGNLHLTDHVCCWRSYIYIYNMCVFIPIGSMYAIYGDIYHQYTPNVSIYTIHGSYGICWVPLIPTVNHWYKWFDILNMPWRRPRVPLRRLAVAVGIASLGTVAFVAPPRGTAAPGPPVLRKATEVKATEGIEIHISYMYTNINIYIYVIIYIYIHIYI